MVVQPQWAAASHASTQICLDGELPVGVCTVHESLGDALHDVKSASWIMELHQQLNSVVNLFTATPHHYIEILLFMCDETAVPNSDSVERWKADWDGLKMLSTLMETAAKVEETAVIPSST